VLYYEEKLIIIIIAIQ